METADFFADEVDVGRPEALKAGLILRLVGAVAEAGDVVGERIHPDVDDVLFVTGNGDAPGEAGATNGKIFEAAADEGDDFVAARLGLDEIGVGLVVLQKRALEGGELEKVVLFRDGLGDAAAVGAGARPGRPRRRLHQRRSTGRSRNLCR